MNNTKRNIYKKVLQEVCEKFNGAETFVREKMESFVVTENCQWKK